MPSQSLTNKHFKDLLSLKQALKNYARKISCKPDSSTLMIAKNDPIYNAICDLEGNYERGRLPDTARAIWLAIQENAGLLSTEDMQTYCKLLLNWANKELNG